MDLTLGKICYNRPMLSIIKQPKYIEKLVTLPTGQVILVTFELIERNGHIIAKAVSGRTVDENKSETEEILCLPCIKSPVEFLPVKSIFSDLLSNFYKDFSFVLSQPTRAPNL